MKRETIERRAVRLGLELTPENRWHDSDNGRYLARWRLHKIGSPYAKDTSYHPTLANVNQGLDFEAARQKEQ